VVVGLYGSTFYLTSAASGCDNVAVLLGNTLRGWLQLGIVYGSAFHGTRLLSGFFGGIGRPI